MALVANLARTQYVELASLDVTGMPVGTFVTDVLLGDQFVLTVSSAAVDHVDTESVRGDSSLRWIKYTGGGGAGTSWYDLEAAMHASLVSELTESVAIPIAVSNDLAILGVGAIDAAKEGGALRGTGGTWNHLVKAAVWQLMSTSKFAISFQAILPTIASSQSGYVGIKNVSTSHQLVIGTDNSQDVANVVCFGYDGVALTSPIGTLGAADASAHTLRIVSNGTTVTFQKAPATGGSAATASATLLTAATHFPAASGVPAFVATTGSTGQAVYKVLYSFVGPS